MRRISNKSPLSINLMDPFYKGNCDEDIIKHLRILASPFIHSASLNALMRDKSTY